MNVSFFFYDFLKEQAVLNQGIIFFLNLTK